MNREYTEQDYKNYMKVVEHVIWETEEKLKSYEKNKKVFSLTFEQWVQWQDGKISLNDVIEVNKPKSIDAAELLYNIVKKEVDELNKDI
jgi:hypothetical protein